MREGGRRGARRRAVVVVVEDWWCCWVGVGGDGWICGKDTGAEFGDVW